MPKKPDSTAKKLYNDAIARKLRAALAVSDYNMMTLSKAANIPYATIYNVLNYRHAPSAFTIARMCVALNLDANELLGVKAVD